MAATRAHVLAFILIVTLFTTALGLRPAPARASTDTPEATLTVTTLQDKIDPNDGLCSLREAMQRAFDNASTGPNDCPASASGNTTIKFGVAGMIAISNGVDGGQLPNIINIVTLVGPITIDAGKAEQINKSDDKIRMREPRGGRLE